jgi:diguanylate cyclase (GGDEF)-like protein
LTVTEPPNKTATAKALILSDNEAQRASFVRLVGNVRNCTPVPFEKVEDALMWAIATQPELIVLIDMRPAHMGLEFLRRAQSAPELIAIPKMFICANDSEARRRAISFGATDCGGTSDASETVERIQNLLALSRVRSQLAIEVKDARQRVQASDSRSARYLRRLEVLYKAAVEGELTDDERVSALLNAGAHSLREGGHFFGSLVRVNGGTLEVLSAADEYFEKQHVKSVPKAGHRRQMVGTLVSLMLPKDGVSVWNDLWADASTVGLSWVREMGLRSALGLPFKVEREQYCIYFVSRKMMVDTPFTEEDGTFIELVAAIVTMLVKERKRTAQLRWQAERDDLTGLPNRSTFRRALARAAEVGKGRKFAVLQFDLDNFQLINDTLGHPVGDAVLVAIAQRLQRALKKGEMVSRLGGDEFAISLAVEGAHGVSERAQELLALFETPVSAAGMMLQVGTTIGGAIYPDHTEKSDELLPRADAALYEGKREERGSFRLFDPAIAVRLEKRRALQSELRDALSNNQFVLYFQPEIDFRTGAIVGAESLIRWRHPERGIVGPGEFIPYAEESTLIRRIGAWTVERACETIGQLTRENPDFRLYVNLSGGQLSDPTLLDSLVEIINARNVASHNLGFEITESMAMADPKLTLDTVGSLRKRGFKIAIDDFGTGYSSLAYLSSLNPDVVKIDKSFVDGVPNSHNDQAIIETVVHFAQKTDRLVLAEGVEELPQMHWLYKAGVNICQGFHVGRPMPVNEFVLWTRRWKATHEVGKALPWHKAAAAG